jgi:hypothetical protein
MTCHWKEVPFTRLRRITGYLVRSLDYFNDGKRAEERDRVKHGIDETGGNTGDGVMGRLAAAKSVAEKDGGSAGDKGRSAALETEVL